MVDGASETIPLLYVVATPIGHLDDMSFRAVRVLKTVHCIAAEDTRHSAKLLAHYAIQTPMVSFYEHNASRRLPQLLAEMKAGHAIALISDAGTPGISDPGYRLIKAAREADIATTMIPGPCAAIMGLVLSGMPVDRFLFLGFLPIKQGRRLAALKEASIFSGSVILYEAPHRIEKTLQQIYTVYGDLPVGVARELTKKFEEVSVRSATEWLEYYRICKPKGEFVLIFCPQRNKSSAQ